MVEFGCGEEFCPFLGVVGTEDSEIGLNFLVGLFSLPISLRVVGSQKVNIIVNNHASSHMNAEANCRPLSEIRESWRPKHLKTWERKVGQCWQYRCFWNKG